ncbi:MAG: U32 family peptidase C-terminal domain-containing protein, partial [Clostridia bacterium]|nr:U32 family peptidase C-terminal domain-containing protein [Clostridia bacterium]
DRYVFDEKQLDELKKVSHRPYYTGFYFGKPDEAAQVYTDSSYIREYDLIGMVTGYDKETKTVTVSQRNRFFEGDEVEILEPKKPFLTLTVNNMRDENDEKISVAPHAMMTVKFNSEEKISVGAMVRKKRN